MKILEYQKNLSGRSRNIRLWIFRKWDFSNWNFLNISSAISLSFGTLDGYADSSIRAKNLCEIRIRDRVMAHAKNSYFSNLEVLLCGAVSRERFQISQNPSVGTSLRLLAIHISRTVVMRWKTVWKNVPEDGRFSPKIGQSRNNISTSAR